MSRRPRWPEDQRRDPWRHMPTGELQDQLLPRWFLLVVGVLVVLGIVVLAVAFTQVVRPEVSVAARRPPPTAALTHDVGEIHTGTSDPQPSDAPCALLDGVRIAGSPRDQEQLQRGLDGLCDVTLPEEATTAIATFANDGGSLRFATFETTGVDSVATREQREATIYINSRFARTSPLWIAPLVAHDAVILAGDPSEARSALDARKVELAVCRRLLGTESASRGCRDAAELLAHPDALGELRGAGYR